MNEPRLAERYSLRARADVVETDSPTSVPGKLLNISIGGCFFVTNKPLPVGTKVSISIDAKGTAPKQLQFRAIVRHIKPQRGMGLEFIATDSHTTVPALLDWIRQLKQSTTSPRSGRKNS